MFLSLISIGVLIGFGRCREGSFLICIKTYSIRIIRGVKLVNLGFLSRSSLFFPAVYPTFCVSFFLSRLLLVPSSFFLFSFIWLLLPPSLFLFLTSCVLCIIRVSEDEGVSVHKAKVGERLRGQLRGQLRRRFKGAVKGAVKEAV